MNSVVRCHSQSDDLSNSEVITAPTPGLTGMDNDTIFVIDWGCDVKFDSSFELNQRLSPNLFIYNYKHQKSVCMYYMYVCK